MAREHRAGGDPGSGGRGESLSPGFRRPGAAPTVHLWSGGKDSAFALGELRRDPAHEVRALAALTTEGYGRTKWHGVRTGLMRRQAAAVGLPLLEIPLPPDKDVDGPEELLAGVVAFFRGYAPEGEPFAAIAWGDVFWPEARRLHQGVADALGLEAVFPVWGRGTVDLARAVIDCGIKTTVCQVATTRLPEAFLGRVFDDAFLADLPDGVDPCGEAGEFQTFVWDGPMFRHPVAFGGSRIARRGDSAWLDLVPAGEADEAAAALG